MIRKTDNFKHTILPSDGADIGDTVRVVIEDAHGATLHGRALDGAGHTARRAVG